MDIRTQKHPRIETRSQDGASNGYLVPIYNVNERYFPEGAEPQQVYLTVIGPRQRKGPHLHRIRAGFFTCIRGNVRIVLKTPHGYREFHSGESHDYLSVEVPAGIAALLINLGDAEAFVLNMPAPAWTPDMNDEHTADFSDYVQAEPGRAAK